MKCLKIRFNYLNLTVDKSIINTTGWIKILLRYFNYQTKEVENNIKTNYELSIIYN